MVILPRLEASRAREIASKLKSISGGKVLDVCTGNGDFISTLMQTLNQYESFVGIDSSKEGLMKAHNKFENQPVQLLEMNAEHLDFADNTFDTVCIAYSLHHLDDRQTVLNEMKRVLKPGGYFIVKEMYQDGEQTPAQITGTLEHHWTAKIDRLFGEFHQETLTRQEIKQLLEALAFSKLDIIDSTRAEHCLFCPKRFDCEDPRNETLVNEFIEGIDKEMERLNAHHGVEELRAEAEHLKELVKRTGIEEASILFAIGLK